MSFIYGFVPLTFSNKSVSKIVEYASSGILYFKEMFLAKHNHNFNEFNQTIMMMLRLK